MNFDKSNVYTSLNADSVKVGSKGFFADNLVALEDLVRNFDPCEAKELIEVENAKSLYRFKSSVNFHWNLFYLVEEPSNEELCTYAELAKWIAQGNGVYGYRADIGTANEKCCYTSFNFNKYLWNTTVPVEEYIVCKWGDAEWHAPTREYMGLSKSSSRPD